MTGPASYVVNTIKEMAAIPLEARERFIAELPAALDYLTRTEAMDDGIRNTGFKWVDDGLCEMRPEIVVHFGAST